MAIPIKLRRSSSGATSRTSNATEKPGFTEPKINERHLLLKIDIFVLSFVCLQYWINYVDRVSFGNAYVTGMKKDLDLKGNEFNLINTCFTIGYILGMLPNNLILLKVQPRLWLSLCTFLWGILTLAMYRANSFRYCCAIRFFQAIFESCTFSGTHLILGSWYREDELPIRSAIFTSAGLVGSMTSGLMQVAIFNAMDGTRGLAGWRWLFIIDFLITLPIAAYGYLFFPGTPDHTIRSAKTLLFSEQELRYAKSRLPIRDETTRLDFSVFKRVLGRWHWWLLSFLWILGGENISFASNVTFSLWLTNQGYDITARNHYPIGIYAVGIAATFLFAAYLNKVRIARHWHIAVILAMLLCVVAILIRVDPLNHAMMFTAQYLGGVAYAGQAVFFSWANVICHNDIQERAIVLASMNMFSGAVNAWWSLLFYSATQVPRFKEGAYALIATSIGSAIMSVIIRVLQVREVKHRLNNLSTQLNYIDANTAISDDGEDDENIYLEYPSLPSPSRAIKQ
ncbi:HDL403Wp [Eremothecium sinecaudum]|uniref:HDL403Wp n=1 Tax=Eremothecium sinecaudum TaxID=45286 RepID=A0A109UYV4_9SACH|nr:HDL403Wp [Eremothecium sinecaudum]AMD20341.1 HDL403Wp [Eremothecium sinecaudum]